MADLTSLWVRWQHYSKGLGYVMGGLLLFVAGWFTGRGMSPYYAAHPIVFTEQKQEAGAPSSGGTAEALIALRQQGIDQANKKDGNTLAEATPQSSTPVPTVAAAIDEKLSPSPLVTPSAAIRAFVGSVNSDKYHHPDCPSAGRIKKENQRWFASEDEAKAAGYTPSECTKEKMGI